MTKEFDEIFESIEKWIKKHNGKVDFIGSFVAYKGKDFNIAEDRMLAYGTKDSLKIELDELNKEIKKEKEDFVNW